MGRDIEEEQELALRWDPTTARWCMVGDADEYRLGEARAAVVRVLKNADGPLSPKDVAEALGKNSGAVRELLSQMVKSGEVVNVSYGKYTVKSPDTPDSPDTLGANDAGSISGVSGVSVSGGYENDWRSHQLSCECDECQYGDF